MKINQHGSAHRLTVRQCLAEKRHKMYHDNCSDICMNMTLSYCAILYDLFGYITCKFHSARCTRNTAVQQYCFPCMSYEHDLGLVGHRCRCWKTPLGTSKANIFSTYFLYYVTPWLCLHARLCAFTLLTVACFHAYIHEGLPSTFGRYIDHVVG